MGVAILMAVALSLDGFGVGLAYGLRRIRIPINSLIAISMCTVLAMGISMLFGGWVTIWLKLIPARILGASILLALGLFQLGKVLWNRNEKSLPEAVPAMAAAPPNLVLEPVFRFQLRFFGLVIQVLKTPDIADVDGSGVISLKESILLGCALAVDAFAGGIGAAMAGMTLSVIGIVALTQIIMLRLGQQMAGKIPANWIDKAEYLPGAVLVLIGLGKLI
ncbi:putative sporulation protein YtaF [Desulfosporosinus orientis DSM 765]|uniref:Putative sporulation protein YtaF n=1 Tax=Desulfosporosinus orientis (strain ATCC 19365 / DSM 765 / NCIMB 8382 / VKM B-1628 / Singapore I) TaxID=768706 RepID=G7WIJ5_DESOD|nr:sporulation membrane protein YtaF [Desulfosporosinus orientis]AET69069.1 putative sporulation protein YtaF [Desulfosporosinus orientis DSM 765]